MSEYSIELHGKRMKTYGRGVHIHLKGGGGGWNVPRKSGAIA